MCCNLVSLRALLRRSTVVGPETVSFEEFVPISEPRLVKERGLTFDTRSRL